MGKYSATNIQAHKHTRPLGKLQVVWVSERTRAQAFLTTHYLIITLAYNAVRRLFTVVCSRDVPHIPLHTRAHAHPHINLHSLKNICNHHSCSSARLHSRSTADRATDHHLSQHYMTAPPQPHPTKQHTARAHVGPFVYSSKNCVISSTTESVRKYRGEHGTLAARVSCAAHTSLGSSATRLACAHTNC